MKHTILVLDLNEVLDQSQFGQRAAQHLKQTWEKAKQATTGQQAEREAMRKLEMHHAELRKQVLEGVQQCLPALIKKYDASYIIEREAALLFPQEADITKEIIEMLDQSTTVKSKSKTGMAPRRR